MNRMTKLMVGKTLCIIAGVILIGFALPDIYFDHEGIAASWNLFLGMILIAAVVTQNPKATLLTLLLSLLLGIRFLLLYLGGALAIPLAINLLLFLLVAGGAALIRLSSRNAAIGDRHTK